MSDSDGTCGYVLDPDTPETWGGNEDDTISLHSDLLNENLLWSCPHQVENTYEVDDKEKELCIFHAPVSEKDHNRVIREFTRLSNNKEDKKRKNRQFVGGKFGTFDLDEDIKISGNKTIYLCCSKFEEFQVRAVEFEGKVDLRGAILDGDSDLSQAKFNNGVNFRCAKFNEDTVFKNSQLKNAVSFENAEFKKGVSFRWASFGGDAFLGPEIRFGGARFYNEANFKDTSFSTEASFWGTEFDKKVDFTRARFDGESNFKEAVFDNLAVFMRAEFFDESTFQDSEFNGLGHFVEARFYSNSNFQGSDFKGANFKKSHFDEGVEFQEVGLEHSQFKKANLTDGNFTGGKLCKANLEQALLSRATLFDTDLRGARLSGAVLGDVRIDEDTKFLGYPSEDSDSSPHTLSAVRSRPTCVYDPDYEQDNKQEDVDKAKSVYRALEELGGKHARPRLQARSFIRRQDLQKQDYWDDATADDASLEERLIAGARWSRAKVSRATLLYGESPWRVITWSLVIIFSFALLYPLFGGMKPTGDEPISYPLSLTELFDSVYYSTLTYTALGFGDFQPIGLAGRFLTTVETGLGAVMLALLVFIFGRRAAR